jgi:hypothetical protein
MLMRKCFEVFYENTCFLGGGLGTKDKRISQERLSLLLDTSVIGRVTGVDALRNSCG